MKRWPSHRTREEARINKLEETVASQDATIGKLQARLAELERVMSVFQPVPPTASR